MIQEPLKPDYLGDAVYATHTDTNSIMLTTGHHEENMADSVIFLEPEVLRALFRYAQRAQIKIP